MQLGGVMRNRNTGPSCREGHECESDHDHLRGASRLRVRPALVRRIPETRRGWWFRASVGLLVLFVALAVLAASAVACEGTGGPPPEPPPEETEGHCNPADPNLTNLCTGDPINNATGDLTEEQTDLSIGGRGPGLHIVRTYDSLAASKATKAGPWGFGWIGPYDASLEVNTTANTATIYQEGGNTAVFYKSGSEYTQGGWTEARLAKESNGNYVYTLPEQSKLEFNGSGELVKETERNGNSNTLTYNASKELEKVEDGSKRTLTFAYNGTGQVEKVTDPMKHEITYKYTSEQLVSVTIEGKVRWEFEYGSPHLLKKIVDGDKHVTTNEYETSSPYRVTKQTIAGHERKLKYGTNETTLTEPNGSETLVKFNAAGEPTKETRAKGKSEETTTEYEYSAETYARTKMIDGNGHEWKYGYEAEGNKTSETNPNSDERKWTYDKKHDVETETTPEGETTTYKLNSNGEPEAVERPIGSETQKTEYKYEKGQVTEETDPLGHKTKYTYDTYGDKEIEKDPEGDERKWKYNEDSQVTEETSPRGFVTTIKRDERGLPEKITDPLSHTTEYTYDGNGNVESETDGNKHTTKYEYNEENLRAKIIEPLSTVEIGYDSEGQMTSRTDGNGHKWEYKRNLLEQVTEEKNPLSKVWKKKYDKAGNLTSVEDPEGHTTGYTYDKSNRLEKIKYSTDKPEEVTYEYNKDSKVKKMTDETGTTENTWDKLDRLTKYKNGAGKTVEYEYNLVNLPTTITYPNGKKVKREYDKDNRLEKVSDWESTPNITSFKYNKDSELEATTFPSGTEDKDEYAYNNADQMSEIKMLKGATELGKLVYERDGDGQVTKTTTSGLTGTATSEDKYDEDNRLIEANKKAYEYDKANNPTKLEGTGTYKYNEANQLTEGPEDKYTYTEDGQRHKTEPKSGEPTTTYTYDQAGNLTNIEREKGTKNAEIKDSYTYNANNLRQSQTIGGTTTKLTWDTAEPIPIILEDETNNYIYGPGNLPIEQIPASGEPLFLHHDQQGSTRLLTNTSGNKETAYTYSPYGTLEISTGTATTPLRYNAQYTSVDTGLTYLRARTYDATTAQFLTIDPALEATGAPYTYTKDNPENSGDPTGMGCPERSFLECLDSNLASHGIAWATITIVGGICSAAGAFASIPTTAGTAAPVGVVAGAALCISAVTGVGVGIVVADIQGCINDPNFYGERRRRP
jgi:RHS repeat-associated protein